MNIKNFLIIVLFFSTFVPISSFAKKNESLAKFNGKKITLSDLENFDSDGELKRGLQKIQSLKTDYQLIVKKKLFAYLREQAILKYVKKNNLQKQELIDQIYDKEPITEDAIKEFYQNYSHRFPNRPFSTIKEQVKTFLIAEKKRSIEEELGSRLLKEEHVKVFFEEETVRTKVSSGGDPSKGPKRAKIKIIEFTDFECPFCRRAFYTVQKVLEKYRGQIHYTIKDFPLSFHENAKPAAIAAFCADQQNQYWDYHDRLWKRNNAELKAKYFIKVAQELNLDMQKFQACLKSPEAEREIAQDIAEGQELGISGTPTFFVNGIRVNGARSETYFSQLIESELKK